ncbi:FecR family protein [Arcticibacter eurypsychrophilus]|uniref:FecR family protein n=1 Tax=Arcticibacter eurypsychrophilus TaxID=1434752 RepID=UPI00084E0089|nr:FecR family protein [Arcticibacter eurypsychrophilus]
MDQHRKKELLKKFADRTLSPSEEHEFWEMTASGAHLSLLNDETELEVSQALDVPDDIEQSLASIKQNLTAKIIPGKKRPQRVIYKIAASVAAVLFLFAGAKGFQYYSFIQDTKTFITVEAEIGKTLKVILPDSSIVTVSSGSVFRYPKAFRKEERRVYLKVGEAFFQVTKNPEKPFSVESGELQTTALGTSFTVEYNSVYHWGKVNLYTGKVAIRPTDKNSSRSVIFLTPGNAYEYIDGKETLSTFNAKPGNPVENGLVFERASFSEAVYRIASWHKVNIVFDHVGTKNFTVNGDFKGKTIDEILSSLSFIHKLKFTKTDSLTYTFMKK